MQDLKIIKWKDKTEVAYSLLDMKDIRKERSQTTSILNLAMTNVERSGNMKSGLRGVISSPIYSPSLHVDADCHEEFVPRHYILACYILV